ncbi:MAG: hypothetical protein JWN89_139 [Parcubacteria group bacterium]|nr:hypothetical protein [Parcubacteria group bacterium]
MILIKAKREISPVHGIGLFADQFIPKGTPTWKYTAWFDSSYSQEDVDNMSEHAKAQFLWYAYFDKDTQKYVLCADDYRFINHSSDGLKRNIHSTPNEDIAARDIEPGEELLCDYNKFDDTYFDRMGLDHSKLV